MFVSQERGASRKPFQKPNILRRKSNLVKLSATKINEPLKVSSSQLTWACNDAQQLSASHSTEHVTYLHTSNMEEVQVTEISGENTSQTFEINGDSITIYAHDTQLDGTEPVQSTLNVESFLNNGIMKQNDILLNIDGSFSSMKNEGDQRWSLHFMTEDNNDNISNCYDGSQISDICNDKIIDTSPNEVDGSIAVVSVTDQNISSQNVIDGPKNAVDCYSTRAIKFKCDEPNCNKGFWTETRLEKHKQSHHKRNASKPTVIECPVKKTNDAGEVIGCGRTFLVRTQLMKHLNEDHSPEDALYRCGKCGRGFYQAAGARAHAVRRSCTRLFACAWAGCGRVFRQPCRLREHARAHTGDRPYPCPYPNCGWAFRSASKLMRHERRHTGERRHQCAACRRAFPRREHLRDHIARHHKRDQAGGPLDAGAALAAGDVESEECRNSVDVPNQLGNVKSKSGNKKTTSKRAPKSRAKNKNMFVIPLTETPSLESSVNTTVKSQITHTTESLLEHKDIVEETVIQDDVLDSGEDRCARTHCTWPLQRTQDYTLEDDAQVEQSEGSESNIYTVRSDLFLHGNVLINEDSEFIISRGSETTESQEESGMRGTAGTLDAALGLIDSHPTIDLMQEELMYADAVDESSFRVLLLNGEELA